MNQRLGEYSMQTTDIIVPKEEYIQLKIAAYKLQLLEVGGVDNWSWYSESLYQNSDMKDPEKYEEQLRKELE